MWFAVALLLLPVIFWAQRQKRTREIAAARRVGEFNPHHVIAEFRKRRGRAVIAAIVALASLPVGLSVANSQHSYTIQVVALSAGFLGLVVAFVVALYSFSCPVCGSIIGDSRGLIIFAKKCPRCGVALDE